MLSLDLQHSSRKLWSPLVSNFPSTEWPSWPAQLSVTRGSDLDQGSKISQTGTNIIYYFPYHKNIWSVIIGLLRTSFQILGDNLGDTEASELFIVRKFVQKVLWGWVQTSECLLSRYCRDSLTNRDGWQTDTGLFEMFVSPVWYSWDVSSAIWSQP